MLRSYRSATRYGAGSYKAWHAWALLNFNLLMHATQHGEAADRVTEAQLQHVVSALRGFCRSISLCRGMDHSLQDLLRLLTLWFTYGGEPRVETTLLEGFNSVDIDM